MLVGRQCARRWSRAQRQDVEPAFDCQGPAVAQLWSWRSNRRLDGLELVALILDTHWRTVVALRLRAYWRMARNTPMARVRSRATSARQCAPRADRVQGRRRGLPGPQLRRRSWRRTRAWTLLGGHRQAESPSCVDDADSTGPCAPAPGTGTGASRHARPWCVRPARLRRAPCQHGTRHARADAHTEDRTALCRSSSSSIASSTRRPERTINSSSAFVSTRSSTSGGTGRREVNSSNRTGYARLLAMAAPCWRAYAGGLVTTRCTVPSIEPEPLALKFQRTTSQLSRHPAT